ncbi:MAG: dihydroorotate dehydrogenase-like protein [Elusimicrobiota bacterium]|jgi:dihydroorotate dehydrogenase (fumarate)
MDLSTTYLGLKLRNPLVPAASPLSDDLDNLKKMEEAGASAIVLRSLFEEQLKAERDELSHHLDSTANLHPEAESYIPEPVQVVFGPEEYLEHIRKAKQAVGIPIIASLNGCSKGGWVQYARRIQEAGADALELNIYSIPTDMTLSSEDVEAEAIAIVESVKKAVKLPLAVKLSPYYSNMANMAKRMQKAGANALVLFNRFYQPDVDLVDLEMRPRILLSTPHSMRLPMTWIGILYGRVPVDLAATSGLYTPEDVIKMIMVGANATMLCSVLLSHGIKEIQVLEQGLKRWMEEHEYESVQQMRGSMSQQKCSDPSSFERSQYRRAVLSYRPKA